MTTPSKYSPDVNAQVPRCPHCAHDLDAMCSFQWEMQISIGISFMLCMYCPNAECRKILGTQILVVPHAQERSIVGPH